MTRSILLSFLSASTILADSSIQYLRTPHLQTQTETQKSIDDTNKLSKIDTYKPVDLKALTDVINHSIKSIPISDEPNREALNMEALMDLINNFMQKITLTASQKQMLIQRFQELQGFTEQLDINALSERIMEIESEMQDFDTTALSNKGDTF